MRRNLRDDPDARTGHNSIGTRFLIATIAFTLIYAVFYISTVQAEDEQGTGIPKLIVKDKINDFGTAVEGETITHDFVLQNRGTSVLYIKKVKTG